MLTREEIIQFQELYLKHFGEKISQEEALDMGVKLVNLIKILQRVASLKDKD